ncbi:MAG: TetR family transcriptional regulator, partial [Pseudoclavibacter sp.]
MSASERRTALVTATVRLIAREGLAAASTRAIAAEAGMPLSTLHYVFESREQLIELAVRNIAADFRMRLDLDAIDFSTVETAIRTAFWQRLE